MEEVQLAVEIDKELDRQLRTEYLYSIVGFCFEMPLYLELNLTDTRTFDEVLLKLLYRDKFDAYCIECNRMSIFHANNPLQSIESGKTHQYYAFRWSRAEVDQFRICYQCNRDANHQYSTFYQGGNNKFSKIGQYPSPADLQYPEAEKYEKILGKARYKEFKRGIGLVTYGVGIGAFVYLRRIFESLINEAADKEEADNPSFSEEDYKKARMEDKILMLEHHLPKFLVEHRSVYGLLSKGIHELEEDECLKHFPALKSAIEYILDESIAEKEKQERELSVRKSIQGVHRAVNSVGSQNSSIN